jgi:hypothetical protein
MKKIIAIVGLFLITMLAKAQNVGINTSSPQATLDVYGE